MKTINGTADAFILEDTPFNEKLRGDFSAATIVEEARIISTCLSLGSLAVDIPIDLQGLPAVAAPKSLWELTLRPVDRAFGGLPPLADKIGAPVARFQAIMSRLKLNPTSLGDSLFETYPAASIGLMGLDRRGYKSTSSRYSNGQWSDSISAETSALSVLLSRHEFVSEVSLSDDDFDATLCALTIAAAAECRLEGARLNERISKCTFIGATAPSGYVLLKTFKFREVKVRRLDFRTWVETYAH